MPVKATAIHPALTGGDLPRPAACLRGSVVVPVKDEEEALPELVRALAGQRELDGRPLAPERYEVILLLNNCTDGTAAVAALLQPLYPRLALHLLEIELPPSEAHVGRARQLLFDLAASRFQRLARPQGFILTTDADTLPAPDWIAQTEREIGAGVDGVGGRITLPAAGLASLPEGVRRYFLLDIGYRRALEEMRSLYAPEEHDPFPRHHQHFGGSMAVTAAAYEAAGGMPPARSSEDVALYRALLASGGRFRHSYRVKAVTSARFAGRAAGGLADALKWWDRQCRKHAGVHVESAAAAERRLAALGLWKQRTTSAPAPWELLATPDLAEEPLGENLRRLRLRNAALREMTLPERLTRAREEMEIVLP